MADCNESANSRERVWRGVTGLEEEDGEEDEDLEVEGASPREENVGGCAQYDPMGSNVGDRGCLRLFTRFGSGDENVRWKIGGAAAAAAADGLKVKSYSPSPSCSAKLNSGSMAGRSSEPNKGSVACLKRGLG